MPTIHKSHDIVPIAGEQGDRMCRDCFTCLCHDYENYLVKKCEDVQEIKRRIYRN